MTKLSAAGSLELALLLLLPLEPVVLEPAVLLAGLFPPRPKGKLTALTVTTAGLLCTVLLATFTLLVTLKVFMAFFFVCWLWVGCCFRMDVDTVREFIPC